MLDRSNKELVALQMCLLGASKSSICNHCGMDQMLPWYWYLYLTGDGAQLVQLPQRSRQGQGLLFRNMSINPLIARIHLEAIRRSTYMDLAFRYEYCRHQDTVLLDFRWTRYQQRYTDLK
ncbi:hypothetical protein CI102_1089 [Trichoderma harzianum]|nr:hypothetical protein CI102_1089 [Trichoderma harzianum]